MAMEGASRGLVRSGWILSGLVIAFLVFDGGTKVLKVQPVLEACARLGLAPDRVVAIGALLLACTALYAAPGTRVLGAILLTGYLGGAVATHVRGGSGPLETAFPIAVGALAWLGLALRDPLVVRAILLRA
ncbi:MAG: DoxX family protein [Deltaproteobacteria bacterium]|nr:DoxX family protein [Deltaproteobacteria bacterium]